MPLPPRTSLGRYEVLSRLGAGGMGEVYLVKDVRLNRQIALKILPENIAADKDRVRRFEQEARAASALNHPNILTVYEIGRTNGQDFIAMEFIGGETLRRKLQTARLEIAESLNIATQIAAALDAAHRSGIVHRDIKPENIMVREDGLVKVLDFGLAKLTERKDDAPVDTEAPTRAQAQTMPGVVMGTLAYMSPEQARGQEVDGRTDIFSFGVMLYEIATHKLPFRGETTSDLIAAILKSEPILPSSFNREIPAELERIILKSLAKDREERYQTARDLLIDLKALKQDLEFRNKLERTAPPNREEAKTQISGATPADALPTTASAEYVVGRIKNHKRGLAIILSGLILAAVGFGYWFYANRTANTKQIESIAVLPFVNGSGNADNEYLSDGMTESLISSLSQIPKLNVKARSSVFRYKGKETDLQKIGRELNVQAILTGRVGQRGEQLILNLELADAATENVLWAEQYDRKQIDLVALQNEIARDVTSKLRVKLSGADEQKLAKNYTENAEAYQLYLRGRFYWNRRTAEGLRKAIEYFNQAIAADPNYASAFAGLADCYNFLGAFGVAVLPPEETMPKAKAAALKAIEIDDLLGEAHASLAFVKLYYDWDWQNAEKEFTRAIELSPNYAPAHQWYSHLLMATGRTGESLAEAKRAYELDPLVLGTSLNLGWQLHYARQYDQAIEQLQKTLELDQNFAQGHWGLGLAYEQKGMFAEAVTEYQRAASLTGNWAVYVAALGHAYAAWGKKGEAIRTLNELNNLSKRSYVPPYWMAMIYAALGEKEQAFEWLEKAYEERSGGLVWLEGDPKLDNLRADPRFRDLIRRVGFPP